MALIIRALERFLKPHYHFRTTPNLPHTPPAIFARTLAIPSITTAMLHFFRHESPTIASEYSLTDVLERFYQNQLALEAAVMELTLWAKQQTALEMGNNVPGALDTIGENAGHIKQGLARLKGLNPT